jgi:hypothetical protein
LLAERKNSFTKKVQNQQNTNGKKKSMYLPIRKMARRAIDRKPQNLE